MFDSIKCAVREFLGIPQMQARIADALHMLATDPVLACVTILCDTPGDDGRIERTTFGGECFLVPGQEHTLKIPYTQRLVANCSYFVSGHPNIVITDFLVGPDSKRASMCGTKFGQCSLVIAIGQQLQVRLAYRISGQSL